MLNAGPFPIIPGLDFLRRTSTSLMWPLHDLASALPRSVQGSSEIGGKTLRGTHFFRVWWRKVLKLLGSQAGGSDDFDVGVFSSNSRR